MFRKYILILILSLPNLTAIAEINVEITPMVLNEGLAQIESMVNNETADAAEEINSLISTYTVKPLIFQAMSGAGSTTASILPLSLPVRNDFAIFSGAAASFSSKNYNIQELSASLQDFAIEEDFYIGAALQAFSIYMSFPGDFLLEDLSFTAGLGYLSFSYDIVDISSSNLHISSSYTFFPSESEDLIKWTGLDLQAGFSLSNNTIAAVYSIENITQTFPIDADGTGPILPFYVTISISPDVNISYHNTQFTIPAALSTGISFLDTVSLHIGAGAAFNFGQNAIDIAVDDEITVEGYLANLIETLPRIIVNGSVPGQYPDIITPFIFGTFALNAGTFYLNIPVSWDFNDTLTAGITFGAGF